MDGSVRLNTRLCTLFSFFQTHFKYGKMKADEIWVGVALANESGLSWILIFCCKLSCSWIISAS